MTDVARIRRPAPRRPSFVALGLAVALLAGACASSSTTAGSTTTAAPKVPATFSGPGPYAVGVTTLQLGEQSVDVWYPAAAGATAGATKATYEISDWLPAAFKAKVPPGTAVFTTDAFRDVTGSPKGPFPLVLFAHGYAGYRDQSTLITTHLASWGFVVAAPDFLSRGLASVFGQKPAAPLTDDQVLSMTADLVHAQSSTSGTKLHGLVKAGKLAVIGHSAGGFDAIHFAAQPDVLTYISMAAGADTGQSSTAVPDKPSLYLSGALDGVVPESGVHDTYVKAPKPKRFVELPDSGHLAFADICLIGSGQGGVTTIAQSLGITIPPNLIKLATDGCEAGRLPIAQANKVTDHFVVAQLRWAFGIDRTPVGLQSSITRQFPTIELTYEHAP